MKYASRIFAALLLTFWLVWPAGAQDESAIILTNGTIFTADPANEHPQAVGIRGKTIVAVGSLNDVTAALGSTAQRLDLQGGYLLPGLIDSHVHAGFAGFQVSAVSFPETVVNEAALRDFAQSQLHNKQAYIEDVLLFMNVPLEYWGHIPRLQAVFNSGEFASIPVILAGSDAHTGWCNTAMLARAGISAASDLPAAVKATFGMDADGTFNGFASEGGWDELLKAAPRVPEARMAAGIKTAAGILHRYGITAWMDPISNIRPLAPIFNASPDETNTGLLPAYKQLLQAGELNAHVSALLLVGINSEAALIDRLLQVKEQFSNVNNLNVIGIKILQDGVLEYPSQTAKLSLPYLNRKDYSGPQTIQPDRFGRLVAAADARGLIVHTHAIGDRAATEALNAVAHARTVNAASKQLHSLTHAQIVRPKDLPRFRQLNVAVAMQFLWSGKAPSTDELVEGSVPAPLLKALYPAGSLLRNGALVAAASDWPVSTPDPFLAMHTAITRQGPSGFLPPENEIISRRDVLYAYTRNAAKLIGRDQEIGSIAVGKSADFALLDQNLETVSVNRIPDTKVLWTMFEGKKIYTAPEATAR